ncbi:MAG TPA: ATP pyrophosphatase, partial [Dehalococcoidia bacterium]|nr:ATP pyrophosphatase [Dehalococcoidia bacterium]
MNKVFISWSGGKESCLACYRAMANGLKVSYLANMVTED